MKVKVLDNRNVSLSSTAGRWTIVKLHCRPTPLLTPPSNTLNLQRATTRLFAPLERYSDDQSSWLALMLENCTIVDEEAFVRIFGDNAHTRALIEHSRRGDSDAKTKKEQ